MGMSGATGMSGGGGSVGGGYPGGVGSPGAGWNMVDANQTLCSWINGYYLPSARTVLSVSIPQLSQSQMSTVAMYVTRTYSYEQTKRSLAPPNTSMMNDTDLQIGVDIMSKVQMQVNNRWENVSGSQLQQMATTDNAPASYRQLSCLQNIVRYAPYDLIGTLYLNNILSIDTSGMVNNLPTMMTFVSFVNQLLSCPIASY